MKNKLLVSAFAMAFVALAFTSCKEKVDFDAICDGISNQTVQGIFSGASLYGDSLFVTEYNFLKDGTAEFDVMVFGDGIYKAPQKTKFSSWEFGEYNNQNLGRYIILHPADGGAPRKVNFIRAAIEEDGLPIMGDKNDKITEMTTVQESVLGKKWAGSDTVFFKIDTVVNVLKLDTVLRRTGYKKDEDGNIMRDSLGYPIWEYVVDHIDTTITPTKMKWPIAPKSINVRRIEINRDSTSLTNTGKWYMMNKEYEINDKRVTTLKVDTMASYDFHWNYLSFKSSSAFSIVAQEDGTNHAEVFEIAFDFRIPTVTVQKQILKEEE